MQAIIQTNAYELYQIHAMRGTYDITLPMVDKVITRLIVKADRIRAKSRKTGDRAIKASNDLIAQACVITQLLHLAQTASKKQKKLHNFKGDI